MLHIKEKEMEKVIRELDQLQHVLLQFKDKASVRKEHFRGLDTKREAEMQGYALAYTQAAGEVFKLKKKLENL